MRFLILVPFLLALSCSEKETFKRPSGIIGLDDHSTFKSDSKQKYLDELYKADESLNVDSLREVQRQNRVLDRLSRRLNSHKSNQPESFANGQILGDWHERGPINEAGDMREVEFDPLTENLYAISVGRHLWKGNLDGLDWELLNDDVRFSSGILKLVNLDSSARLLACFGTGTLNKELRYSDDEGHTWTLATGFSFYDQWGSAKKSLSINSDSVIYYMAHSWQASPWGKVIQLYESKDFGVTFEKIWNSSVGYDYHDADIWKLPNSDTIYLLDHPSEELNILVYDKNVDSTKIINTIDYSLNSFPALGVHLSGWNNSGHLELYAFCEGNDDLYQSLDTGLTWTYLSTCPEHVWRKAWMVNPNTGDVYVGGFQLNKSFDGINWQEQYPYWWTYYSDSKDSMHVDMMNLDYFEKSDGTPFFIMANHAGIYVSYDDFNSTQNLGLNNLNVVTLYDQTTASDGFVYGGAQDKGTFVYDGDSKANFNTFATLNRTTGDGMIGEFINNEQSFVSMIQNGQFGLLRDRTNASPEWYTIPGTTKPGWINPMTGTPDSSDNIIYMAGGNLNGGPGSYLIQMDFNLNTPPVFRPFQFGYDFRDNSVSGNGIIKAIGVSYADHNRIFVATSDGTFFHTLNKGLIWYNEGLKFAPDFIPWDIVTANADPNDIYVSGTGFSNPGVYRSEDGGDSFYGLTNQAPLATYYEIVLSDNDDVLFAATSEGPFAYVFADDTWYPLTGTNTPIVDFTTVDNIGNGIIRFATYGRGIWDFDSEININPLAIENTNNLSEFRIYPNPIKSGQLIYLNLEGELANGEIEIFDLNGTRVFSSQIIKGSSISPKLSKGQYLIRLRKDRVYSTKMIVQ